MRTREPMLSSARVSVARDGTAPDAIASSGARVLLWIALLLSLGLYLAAHQGVLLAPTAGEFLFPAPRLPAPRGGLAPWIVVVGAVLGGRFVAARVSQPLRAVAWALGSYLCLVVPAHVLGVGAWMSGRGIWQPWLWAAGVWLLAAGLALLRHRPSAATAAVSETAGPAEHPRDPLVPWLVVAGLTVAGLHGHAIGRTIRHGARAWDGESYHLPVALQWIHTRSLTEPLVRLAAISPWEIDRFANPGNGHLLMSVPLTAGWDLFAWIAQLPFLAVGAWGVYALGRAAHATSAAAILGVLAFLSAPIVADQAAVPMLDLATAALSLAAVALLLPAADADAVPAERVALAGLACGLALGTKTTALAQLGLVGTVVATSRWAWAAPARSKARAAALFLGLMLLPSSFWYVRSAVLFGNPIHPLEVRVLGHVLFPGTTAEDMSGSWDVERMNMRTRWEWLVFPFRDPEYSDETGFGALLVASGAAGLLAGGAVLARSVRERRLTPAGRLALVGAAALLLFWFAAARTPRFNLTLLAVLAALSAPAVDALGRRLLRHAAGLMAVAAAAVTLTLSLRYHGWDMGPPFPRVEQLETDYPGIPAVVDALPPLVLLNDTRDDESARPSNYKLFGADHRHLVYDHPQLATDDAEAFIARLRLLGADTVFLRIKKERPLPPRYATPALEPLARFEGREFRSVIYRVR